MCARIESETIVGGIDQEVGVQSSATWTTYSDGTETKKLRECILGDNRATMCAGNVDEVI